MAIPTAALDEAAAIGAEAPAGVTLGGIGRGAARRRPKPSRTTSRCASLRRRARDPSFIASGTEPANRCEFHPVNAGRQAVGVIERFGSDHILVPLDADQLDIQGKGAANGILAARDHLRCIHLSEGDRGVPGAETRDWHEICADSAATGFKGGPAMESFIRTPEELAWG